MCGHWMRAITVATVIVVAASCAGADDSSGDTEALVVRATVSPESDPAPPVSEGTEPQPDPLDEWDIAFATLVDPVEVTGIADPTAAYNARADATSIHLVAQTSEGTEVLRIDRASGDVAARRTVAAPVAPYDRVSAELTRRGLVLADGDRSTLQLLDDSLATIAELDLPPDSRTVLDQSNATDSAIWIPHIGLDEDLRNDRRTFSGFTTVTLDPFEVTTTVQVPGLGLDSAMPLRDGATAIALASHFQLGVVDADGATERILPAFPIGAQLRPICEDQVLVNWARLAYLAKWDPTTDDVVTLDLSTDGPVLATTSRPIVIDENIWVLGEPADTNLPRLAIQVDPASMTVVSRAWLPDDMTLVGGDDLVTVVLDGSVRAARIDPASVVGGAPSTVVRPEIPSYEPVEVDDDAQRAAIEALTRALDPAVVGDDVADVLESADHVAEPRQRLADLAGQVFPGVAPTVTSITVAGNRAELVYVFLMDGIPVGFPLTAGLDRGRDGKWRLRAESLCRLAGELQIDCPELPGP